MFVSIVCMAATYTKQETLVSPVDVLFKVYFSLWPLKLHCGGQEAILNAESFLD